MTDIRTVRSWVMSDLARPGTGRHRGECADEECRAVLGDACPGHGRHRGLPRPVPVPVPAYAEYRLHRGASATHLQGPVPGWEHRTGDEFGALDTHTLHEAH
ncbi:hypothetical protein DI272_38575 [Streptomyces sp. Act143]|nr:hypothetical protein DI272_38575 [Streptomyces sp. Act143]